MASLVETLGNLPVANLSAQLEVANGTLKFSADGLLDPSKLLGPFGKALRDLDLPSDPDALVRSISEGLGHLQSLGQYPRLSILSDVVRRTGDLGKHFEELSGHFQGDLRRLTEELLSPAGGLQAWLGQLVNQLLDALPIRDVQDAAGAFQTLQSLVGKPLQSPNQVAQLLCRLLASVSLDDLHAPTTALNGFLNRIRSAGGDLSDLQQACSSLTVRLRTATTLLRSGSAQPDALLAEVNQIGAGLDLLVGSTLPGALGRFTADLSALDPQALFLSLDAALQRLTQAIPRTHSDLFESVGATVGEMFQAIANTTEQELREKFEHLRESLLHAFDRDALRGATATLDEGFDFLIGFIREIPLRQLRHELIDVLNEVEGRLRGFQGFALPTVFFEKLNAVADAVDGVDTSSIRQAVQGVVDQVNGVVASFPIQQIRTEIEGLIGQLTDVVRQLDPLLESVQQQLDALAGQADQIDLSAAGQASVGLMQEIRTNLREVAGSGEVPDAAKSAISAGASVLKEINLTVEIRQPFHAALAGIDPSAILAPIQPVLGKVRDTLAQVSPAALITRLDTPFAQLEKELAKLRPASLLASVSSEFSRFTALIDKASPSALVAPLEAAFQDLLNTLRKALDPAPLFAPLHDAFNRLKQLLKSLDVSKLIEGIAGQIFDLPKAMSGAVQGALASRGIQGAPQLPKATGEFKVSGFLLPVTHLIGQLRRELTRLARHLLEEAWNLLRQPLQALHQLAQPALGAASQLAQTLDERLQQLDLFSPSGPTADLRLALEEFFAARHAVTFDASTEARLGPATARLHLNARVDLLAAPRATAHAQRQRLLQHQPPPNLSQSLERLGNFYAQLLPPSLQADGPVEDVVALLNQLLDVVDPTPLARKLDEVGAQALNRLRGLLIPIVQGVFDLLNDGIGLFEEFTPKGILNRLQANIDRLTAEFLVLDPTPIEAELREIVDAAVSLLDPFSPARIASAFDGIFTALRSRLESLNPAQLLGDLSAIDTAIDGFAQLKPSLILAPLLAETAEIDAMLQKLSGAQVGEVVVQAVVRLKAQLEEIVAGIEQELQALLNDLEQLAGNGNASVSVSASVG